MTKRLTIRQRFFAWVKKGSGRGLGNLHYALEDPDSTASLMFEAYQAGWAEHRCALGKSE